LLRLLLPRNVQI